MRLARRPFAVLLLLAAPVLAPPAAATAATPSVWATVNVCDTAERPDTLGIRAGVRGNGARQRIYMRFQAQWYDAETGLYRRAAPATRYLPVGSARFRVTQGGWSFEFEPPLPATEYTLRGVVSFEWRARRRGRLVVVRRARRVTRSGIRGVEEGDPPGTSAATCVISG